MDAHPPSDDEASHAHRMFAVFAGQTDGAFTAAGCDRKRFATEYAFELTPFRRRLAFMIADGMRAEAEERFVEQELAVHPQAA